MSIAAPAVSPSVGFRPSPSGRAESRSAISDHPAPGGFSAGALGPLGPRPRRSTRPVSPADARVAPNATLVAAAIDGEEWAWEALVHRYRGLVAAITRSYRVGRTSADDVEQIVWMRLYEHLPRIRRPEALGGWVAAVSRNACLRLKQRQDREVPADEQVDPVVASEECIEASVFATERSQALRRAVTGLPLRRRRLLEALLDQPELTHEELGRRIGMPTGSIGPTRFRSIEQLRTSPVLAGLAD